MGKFDGIVQRTSAALSWVMLVGKDAVITSIQLQSCSNTKKVQEKDKLLRFIRGDRDSVKFSRTGHLEQPNTGARPGSLTEA